MTKKIKSSRSYVWKYIQVNAIVASFNTTNTMGQMTEMSKQKKQH